ncbi:hypothetical protein ACLOJK_022056 [Asimina triloba]
MDSMAISPGISNPGDFAVSKAEEDVLELPADNSVLQKCHSFSFLSLGLFLKQMRCGGLQAVCKEVVCCQTDEELPNLIALQLTLDHSTSIKEEVERIRSEHPDDASAVVNDRVKGSLKVTRAFGAGFLKQPKWNNALLEMFRIDSMAGSLTCSWLVFFLAASAAARMI